MISIFVIMARIYFTFISFKGYDDYNSRKYLNSYGGNLFCEVG